MSSKFTIEDHILVRYDGNETVVVVPEGVTKIGDKAFGVDDWTTPPKIKSITLPSTVKEVGYRAFANLKKLESYTAPAGIVYSSDVFCNCQRLANEEGLIIIDNIAMEYIGDAETVTVPEGTYTLRPGLFMERKQLRTVHLPASLKRIGKNVFADCVALEKVNLPEGLTDIEFRAFYHCTSLHEANLPASLTTLDEEVFCGCESLVDDQGFVIRNNTLYSYHGTEKNVIIPEGIETIAADAFSNTAIMSIKLPATLKRLGAAFDRCKMLTEITIPEGVEELPAQVFSNCIRLVQVNLPSTLKAIGNSAFSGCEDLTSIVIPHGVRQVGRYAFENCTRLQSIVLPDQLSVIEDKIFSGCTSLEYIELPASVTEIKYMAFEKCNALKGVKIAESANINIDTDAFDACTSLVDQNGFIVVGNHLLKYVGAGGDVVVPEGVEFIVDNTFREGADYYRNHYRTKGSLHSVTLPKTLKWIGANAFSGCENLHELQLPDGLSAIMGGAFKDCGALQSVRIPDTVTIFGPEAFANCNALKQVELGNGINALPDSAFQECTALQRIRISKFVEKIGTDAFLGCRNLTVIDVDEANPHFSSVDGILLSKDKTELLLCPGGKKLIEFVIPDFVSKIATKAFIDCMALTKVVIPATVKHIGDNVFYRETWFWKKQYPLTDITVSLCAGSSHIGSGIFSFPSDDAPLVFPKLPISFVREISIKTRLAMGYCQHPEQYEGDYATSYKEYVDSHEKAILKKATQLKLADVEAYYAQAKLASPEQSHVYKPKISAKKLSDKAKVELLEEAVMKGTVEDVKLVLQTYKDFELTARALALAGRYRGFEFVKTLAEAGATFTYSQYLTKYKSIQNTAAGSYRTEYYLMLVPSELHVSAYLYSPLCGVLEMEIPPEREQPPLPVETRFEIAKYCCENEQLHASMDEMLFWALTRNDLTFADLAMAYGADLNTTPPSYYSYYMQNAPTYLDVITSGNSSLFWNAYVEQLTKLSADVVLPTLERLDRLAQAAGKKLAVSQKLFNETDWCDESLVFLLEHADMSKVNQKKALELVVSKGFIAALDQMVQMGWLSNAAKREKLIEFARSTNLEALAWLMDFKNRTVDVQAEAAKEEEKFLKELNEDPNSVTALKRLWSYKKLEDGTLIITSYKGEETDVMVPAMIGKAKVTVIGEEAFSASSWVSRIKNREARKKIRSITLPEGIVELQSTLLDLDELEKVVLPSSLKKIAKPLVRDCNKLKEINIPAAAQFVGDTSVLWRCQSLQDKDGFAIINGILYAYQGKHHLAYGYRNERHTGVLTIPEGVTQIGDYVFDKLSLKAVSFPQSLKAIGENAFEKCPFLEIVEIPGTVEKIKAKAFKACYSLETIKLGDGVQFIGTNAFADCNSLREVYIPASVKRLSKEIFGPYDDSKNNWGSKVSGICVHTQEGAPILEYTKQYAGIHVVFDYDKAMKE